MTILCPQVRGRGGLGPDEGDESRTRRRAGVHCAHVSQGGQSKRVGRGQTLAHRQTVFIMHIGRIGTSFQENLIYILHQQNLFNFRVAV